MNATPAAIRAALEELGLRPSRKLGQNFLCDANVLRRILGIAAELPDLPVLEIGPGLGQVCGALLGQGFEVHAVEFDHRLAARLRRVYAENLAPQGRFHLVEADAVDLPRGDLSAGVEFQIVSNLPYAITSPWLEGILAGPDPLPRALTLLIQAEAWDRLQAGPGSRSRAAMSVFLEAAYQRDRVHPVARGCFFPPPEVDSMLVRLTRRENARRFRPESREAIRQLFGQRRKQVGGRLPGISGEEAAQRFLAVLRGAGLGPQCRPEEIPTSLWEALDASTGEGSDGAKHH